MHAYSFTPGPDKAPENPHVRAWQAHLDAGRIGYRPSVDPAIAANTAATAALFRCLAREARA